MQDSAVGGGIGEAGDGAREEKATYREQFTLLLCSSSSLRRGMNC